MGYPQPLFRLFSLFSNINKNLQQINMKNYPPSLCRWDSNSQPLGRIWPQYHWTRAHALMLHFFYLNAFPNLIPVIRINFPKSNRYYPVIVCNISLTYILLFRCLTNCTRKSSRQGPRALRTSADVELSSRLSTPAAVCCCPLLPTGLWRSLPNTNMPEGKQGSTG